MASDAPASLAAELAAITKRNEFASDRYAEMSEVRESAEDVPRLVAAVEAALDLHKPDGYFREVRACDRHAASITTTLGKPGLAAAQDACPDCRVTEGIRCWQRGCPSEWPCPTYAAISAALTGEDGTDAH